MNVLNKLTIILSAYCIVFSALAVSNTAITNLNTMQMLQRNQIFSNSQGENKTSDINSVNSGRGYPVYDPSAILQAKKTIYEEWKKQNHSEMSYEVWEKTKLNEILNQR